ncbi:TetR/AcrR family transcriptional regulator [Belliella kenyensis]|uniref:TetR/AcrR family transcriptional regulator n=1 Tax=Belliella kenyensis TaxID=1472724 RepID=A0ABV8EG27_9BACT|nr:TetR/AcrR family transcriptional regulator [Belliella kenyensis]MCH7401183.1 TetR/AcrR family transcriptional regulator [Belliella kenyensis]MDN3604180.1 TetR family transcriptional regulator C-terminal domain-containing protein [Belliella kenyensis]
MEKEVTKKTSKVDPKTKIVEGYMAYILEHGQEPASIFKFAKELKMKEEDFYNYYTSFEAIKSAVWEQLFDRTIVNVESQEVYTSYSSREKLLSFLFTWIEELKKNRSYLLVLYGSKKDLKGLLPSEVKVFKGMFKDFANEIILAGKETEEIADRPVITDRYDDALWLQVWFVFQFWLKDTSPAFEKTDAAIEKSVNLAFDLMGKSALDTFIDFAKFLYQQK